MTAKKDSVVLTKQENPDSISLKQTAKGEYYWDCKCYGNMSTKKGVTKLI